MDKSLDFGVKNLALNLTFVTYYLSMSGKIILYLSIQSCHGQTLSQRISFFAYFLAMDFWKTVFKVLLEIPDGVGTKLVHGFLTRPS